MRTQLHRGVTYTAFQTSLMLAIALLPLALMVRRTTGVVLPLHRLVDRTRRAYDADR